MAQAQREERMLASARRAAASAWLGGGPFYLYDIDVLVESVSDFIGHARSVGSRRAQVFFPMFANPNLELLRALVGRVPSCGILVNSPEEAEILAAESIGDRSARVFTGGVLGRDQLMAVARACETVHCSSLGDFEALLRVAHDRSFAPLRVGLRMDFRGDALKGLTRSEFDTAYTLAQRAGIRISSVHSYPGTEIDSMAKLLLHAQLVLELSSAYAVDTLNFGGGFGYDYTAGRGTLDIELFFRRFGALVGSLEEQGRLRSDIEFAWEPGRLLGASAGVYVCRVIEVRRRQPGFCDLYVDGTFAHLPAPKVRNRQHRVTVVAPGGERREGGECLTRVCGATTLSTDTLLPAQVLLPEAAPGDLVVVWDVGCYGRSGSHNFLGRPLPAEVGIEGGSLRLLRAAQRPAEIFGVASEASPVNNELWLERV